jgi:hypothetical protein
MPILKPNKALNFDWRAFVCGLLAGAVLLKGILFINALW